MTRSIRLTPFTAEENGKRMFSKHHQRWGTLEYPLTDPGTAREGEGILWFEVPLTDGSHWDYVHPVDFDEEGEE